ncbi:glycosyltransferase family 2 protein [Kitasatospora cathayae]|uniref:Glycosyltransferase family 2 protein n=1 Tax=Kitasatospora cathayae TaxID=3004092 RepID=A0ABY7Q7T0_9ACTN|nr:glycosyltransferase family 2 protein [Kitasatospora sp. HUAS 3-15]WBP88677.1 glycosyltransferase family 2 protein [Kitasatospora sp. HUAS 3-15]
MTVPDVTVVVAVYNTMPYLTACLDSLVGQSLAPGRLEAVVVDDGSTDGGEALLDEYAARHPELFRVVHQPNSGGPAGPANRGLAMARGRYVLFLGADDRLGPEALERLVAAADAWGSDVVVPKQVGVNGRLVPQGIFHADAESVGFTDSALAWALSDTKLFRLDLIRRHGLCHNEELKVFSDQSFTLEACLRAGRVSVLAGYDSYFLVLREDRGNVTERASVPDRLRGIAALQQVAADLAQPGEELDAIRARSFGWDVPRLLQDGFLLLDDGLQRRVCVEVGRLVERFGARAVYHRLPVAARLRLELAVAVRPEALRDQIRYEAAHGEPPVVVDGRRHYAGYPALRDARLALPDELFLLREEPLVADAPPLNLAQQLWRGVVPEQLRRGLRRHPAWRRLANSVNRGRG